MYIDRGELPEISDITEDELYAEIENGWERSRMVNSPAILALYTQEDVNNVTTTSSHCIANGDERVYFWRVDNLEE